MFPHKDFVLNGADEQEPIYFGVPKVAITEVNLGTSTNSQEVWVYNSLSFTQKKTKKNTSNLRFKGGKQSYGMYFDPGVNGMVSETGPVENLVHGTLHLQQLPHLCELVVYRYVGSCRDVGMHARMYAYMHACTYAFMHACSIYALCCTLLRYFLVSQEKTPENMDCSIWGNRELGHLLSDYSLQKHSIHGDELIWNHLKFTTIFPIPSRLTQCLWCCGFVTFDSMPWFHVSL